MTKTITTCDQCGKKTELKSYPGCEFLSEQHIKLTIPKRYKCLGQYELCSFGCVVRFIKRADKTDMTPKTLSQMLHGIGGKGNIATGKHCVVSGKSSRRQK